MQFIYRYFYVCLALLLVINLASAQGFIENSGQLKDQNNNPNNNTLFIANYGNFRVHLNSNGFSYELISKHGNASVEDIDSRAEIFFDFNRIDVILENHSFEGTIFLENKLGVERFYQGSNYYEAGVYQTVTYKDVYSNIDLVFYTNSKGFKYDFVVHPGGNVADIVLNFKSPFDTYLSDGSVLIDAPLNKIKEVVPLSYFLEANQEISVEFKALMHDEINHYFSFESYNKQSIFEHTLVIDPMPNLWFGTFISGNLDEYPQDVTIDKQGNIYAVGFTNSINNIASSGAFQETFSGVFDAFLIKYAPDGTKLWGTYIGGSSFDRAYGVTYKEGYVYVCGNSFSSGIATPGVHQTINMNADDVFLAKFSVDGIRIWCTYYGGELHDFGESVVIDDQNNLYITGHTLSFTNIATLGAHQESFFGVSAGFLAKFTNSGQLIWGTYYGSSFQEAYGLALDSDQNIVFGGFTSSSSGIASPGAHQTTLGGQMDAFLAKFNPSGQRLWGTYLGGAADDFGYDVCVDGANNIYLMGNTSSDQGISFGSGFQLTPSSVDDGFVAKFSASGTMLWSTYVGGNEAEYLKAIEPFYNEGVIVVGKTQSNNAIATPGALIASLQGEYDAFMMKISNSGALEWGTYYGGSLSDEFTGVGIRESNTYIHAVGFTLSNAGIATPGSHQTESFGGMFNGFLAQFCAPIVPSLLHDIGVAVCDDNEYLIEVGPVAFDAYLWNTGSTQSSILLTDLVLGNSYEFYVNTIDTNNCAYHSDTLIFGVFPEISVEIEQLLPSYCALDSITLAVDDVFISYLWSTGGTAAVEPVFFSTAGNAIVGVEVMDVNGCLASDEVVLNILPAPSPLILVFDGSTNFCVGETVEVSTSENYFAYNWSNGSTQESVVISEDTWLYVTVFNELGCSLTSDSIWLGSGDLNPTIIMLSEPPICPGINLEFGLTQNYDSYAWNTGHTSNSASWIAQPGNQYIAIEVGNLCGDFGYDTLFFIVPEYPIANIAFIQPALICYDTEMTFSLPGAWSNVLWMSASTGQIFTAQPNIFGPWEVYVEAIANNGCSASDTVVLNVLNCYLGVNNESHDLFVFPNPFTEVIQIASDFPITNASIHDISGKKVFEINDFPNIQQLVLDFLVDGVYFLTLFDDNQGETRFIIVKVQP